MKQMLKSAAPAAAEAQRNWNAIHVLFMGCANCTEIVSAAKKDGILNAKPEDVHFLPLPEDIEALKPKGDPAVRELLCIAEPVVVLEAPVVLRDQACIVVASLDVPVDELPGTAVGASFKARAQAFSHQLQEAASRGDGISADDLQRFTAFGRSRTETLTGTPLSERPKLPDGMPSGTVGIVADSNAFGLVQHAFHRTGFARTQRRLLWTVVSASSPMPGANWVGLSWCSKTKRFLAPYAPRVQSLPARSAERASEQMLQAASLALSESLDPAVADFRESPLDYEGTVGPMVDTTRAGLASAAAAHCAV